ncbi:MAG: hypothetical protein KM296_00545 [Brockia lithotrophica]|nr:hypothetical protein [Brockia lithotrophica]
MHYRKGRNAEYAVKRKLEKEGYIVIRSAGSHSPADLIAVNEEKIVFVQVKSTNNPSQIRQMFMQAKKELSSLPSPPYVEKRVYVKLERTKKIPFDKFRSENDFVEISKNWVIGVL